MNKAYEEYEAQGKLKPGEKGWWQVWGANVGHIREGDLILHDADGDWVHIQGLFEAKAAPLRRGFIDHEGERFTLGVLVPVIVVRQGTHNTLA